MTVFSFRQIGIIHSPFEDPHGMPVQPAGAQGVTGKVIVFPEYAQGLTDLDGFSHIVLLYLFHRTKGYDLKVTPFLDARIHGLFATRAPKRPNPIGLSVVRLIKLNAGELQVQNIDILNQTPLLDIKPYVPKFDHPGENICVGWLEESKWEVEERRSDDRFK